LLEIQEQYGDARRTEIDHNHQDLEDEDLIAQEARIVTLSRDGYIKTQPLRDYRAQHRGGRGKAATQMKEEDEAATLVVADTHDWLLFFSNRGKVYWQKTWQLPLAGRNARGKPIVNVLPLEAGESITAILPVKAFEQNAYVVMATRRGTIKRVALADFSRPRRGGIIAIELMEEDALVDTALTDGHKEVMLFSSGGKAIRFDEDEVRVMGRTARGVRGMKLPEGQHIVSMEIVHPGTLILTATANGYGKCTPVEDYSKTRRGAQGVISIKTTARNGEVVAAVTVTPEDEVVLITNRGTLVRTPVAEISVVGRNTQGVKLMNLGQGEQLVDVAKVAAEEDENDEESNHP